MVRFEQSSKETEFGGCFLKKSYLRFDFPYKSFRLPRALMYVFFALCEHWTVQEVHKTLCTGEI